MDHGGIMESLSEEQQLQVFNLMSIGNIEDMDFAAQLLVDAGFDLNKAAQKLIDVQSGVEPTHEQVHEPDLGVHGTGMNIESEGPQVQRTGNEDLRLLYRRHLENKERQESASILADPVKKGVSGVLTGMKNVWNSVVPVGIRGETPGGEQFLLYLRQHYEKESHNLKFHVGTFEENIQKASEYKKPLLVYVHVDSEENKEIPREIVASAPISNLINNKFYSLGLLGGTEGIQSISKYIPIGTNCLFAVFRTNLLDEIQLLETIPVELHTDVFDLEDHLKSIEGNYYLLMAEEDKIKNEVRTSMQNERRDREREVFNNYYDENQYRNLENFTTGTHINPEHTIANQERLEEDRILRQIQEEEYKEVERKIREQQEMQAIQESIKMQEEEEERKVAFDQAEKKQKLEKEREEAKKTKLKNLPPEPAEGVANVISIAFRTPNGNRVERRFTLHDKAQVLYDYIDTQDIAYDKNTVRYDLIQPRPFLVLDDKNKTLNDYFEGSSQEILQIREHAE